jgi:hypothetical protein
VLLAGDATGYLLGRRFLLAQGPRVHITEPRLLRVEAFFVRYGPAAILIGRLDGLVRAWHRSSRARRSTRPPASWRLPGSAPGCRARRSCPEGVAKQAVTGRGARDREARLAGPRQKGCGGDQSGRRLPLLARPGEPRVADGVAALLHPPQSGGVRSDRAFPDAKRGREGRESVGALRPQVGSEKSS